MKKITLLFLVCLTPLVAFAEKITAPNMEVGHWVSTFDHKAMVEAALALMPEESRNQMRDMIEQQMEKQSTSEQCITPATLENFGDQLKDSFGNGASCEFKVTESTKENFIADLNCPGSKMKIVTKFINSKRNESTVVTDVPGMGKQTISSVSEWKSSVCPEGV